MSVTQSRNTSSEVLFSKNRVITIEETRKRSGWQVKFLNQWKRDPQVMSKNVGCYADRNKCKQAKTLMAQQKVNRLKRNYRT